MCGIKEAFRGLILKRDEEAVQEYIDVLHKIRSPGPKTKIEGAKETCKCHLRKFLYKHSEQVESMKSGRGQILTHLRNGEEKIQAFHQNQERFWNRSLNSWS